MLQIWMIALCVMCVGRRKLDIVILGVVCMVIIFRFNSTMICSGISYRQRDVVFTYQGRRDLDVQIIDGLADQ